MHLRTVGAAAALLMSSPGWASLPPLLGSDPQEAIRMFREADAGCQAAHCRQRGRYGLGTTKGKTHVLYYTWDQARPLSLEQSRKSAAEMILRDAQRIRRIANNDGSVAEVFSSETLARTFGSDPQVWIGARPGTFVVFHSVRLRQTIISVGDYQ